MPAGRVAPGARPARQKRGSPGVLSPYHGGTVMPPTLTLDLSTATVVVDFAAGGVAELVAAVRTAGGAVVVVAEDDGSTAEQTCAPLGAEVLTNPVDPQTGRVEYPYDDRRCPCTTCDICKQAPIRDARDAGRTTVLVSGRLDDQKAALLADVVFATGALAAWCRAFDVAHRPFDSTDDVRAALGG